MLNQSHNYKEPEITSGLQVLSEEEFALIYSPVLVWTLETTFSKAAPILANHKL